MSIQVPTSLAAEGRYSIKNATTGKSAASDTTSSYVAAVVAAAPPLTPEQRDRLSTLLREVAR